MRRLQWITYLSLVVAALGGCANLNTISRSTQLPTSGGLAIHLDAQQRLVIYSAAHYCAEPSPDALQAYAASLGLGASIPSQGAGSLAGAQQSNAGSIGLRTQTITIMRDALYRMCEAYNNAALGDVMVATLLERSQDLTAVILAVEQLTGAVAANQVILTGSSNASAAASLVANDQALSAAQDNENKKKAAVTEATNTRDAAEEARNEAKSAEQAAQGQLQEAKDKNPQDPMEVAEAQNKLSRATEAREEQDKVLADAENDLAAKKEQLANAEEVRKTIEAAQDAALTDASATTGGTGKFSVISPAKQLSPEATKEISQAVQTMVLAVLDKSYAADSCMALLTSKSTKELKTELGDLLSLCVKLVSAGIEKELKISTYEPDDNSALLEMAIEQTPALRGKIADWLKGEGLSISVTLFVNGKDYAEIRKRAVAQFGLSNKGK